MEKKVNFKEFEKPELVEALDLFMGLNLLPSMEEYLINKLNSSHFNRVSDERNSMVLKLNELIEKRQTKQVKAEIKKLMNQIDVKTRSREKRLNKMLELKIVTQEQYDDLTLNNK